MLIVGAGPTGLLTALDLIRHGVKVRIVDKGSGPSTTSKALALQARSIELLEDLGLAKTAIERGRVAHAFNLYASERRIVHISFDELDSPFPFLLVLPQSDTERLFIEALEAQGVTIEWNHEVTDVTNGDDHATATIIGGDETASCLAKWIVAADGAHSTVRKSMDVEYEGEDIDGHFCFVDADAETPFAQDEGHVFFHPDGVMGWIPLPEAGRWRIIASVDEPVDRDIVDSTYFAGLAGRRMHLPVKLSGEVWSSAFTIRQRKVTEYKKGRVFFAGDAAHCHSPVGGQGLNTGLQDAYNLAWKLGLVVRGAAKASLLSSYDAEREPVAKALLAGTGSATKVATLRHPVGQQLRNSVAGFLTSLDVVQQRLTRNVGELNLDYRQSPIVAEDRESILRANVNEDRSSENATVGDWLDFGRGPHPGDRALDAEVVGPDGDNTRLYPLLHDTKHTLLLFDGHAATKEGYDNLDHIASEVKAHFGDFVSTYVVIPSNTHRVGLLEPHSLLLDPDGHLHHRYGAGAECQYLIRPDIYVGYRSQPAKWETLQAYLRSLLG